MTVVRLDHVQLAMPGGREPDAVGFYAGILGLDRVDKPEHLKAQGGCWFEGQNVKVHLGVEPDFRPALKAHPAFVVSDLDALLDRLHAVGIETRDAEPLGGVSHVYVNDPFGNRIELIAS